MSPIINAIRRGDYFVTSGEVLIPSSTVEGTGTQRTVVADLEWTFPLELVEVVWGDGQTTERQVIAATDLPPFGRHRFRIPLNMVGKKWVRFAVWDSAGNGALTQPVKLCQAGGYGEHIDPVNAERSRQMAWAERSAVDGRPHVSQGISHVAGGFAWPVGG